ncbi:hypothetical protein CCUS01_02766 [Colletotrichum cuscutae]|uniref:Uncharacterized protein n=1 Tax=Colletotrichum cuscutae TaxID=1209917 RepID=A0AAI9YC09_9PEZI|nr:hypothetical protein CSPX01_14801 [Colletotrichum filicis]KAK1496419.1 hypothetical protein CCUS01_02766 [Colletotrichum cuscutae]
MCGCLTQKTNSGDQIGFGDSSGKQQDGRRGRGKRPGLTFWPGRPRPRPASRFCTLRRRRTPLSPRAS